MTRAAKAGLQKPNDRLYMMICIDVPDRVSKNLVLCPLHFTTDSLTNKAQFDTGFSERLKLKDDALPIILDPMSHHTSVSNCFHYVITIALSVKQII